jgi:molybdopterin-dependent oxidoreductase alpha subunit
MRKPNSGGGWQAIKYVLAKGRQTGFLRLWKAMRSKNACKTCALGMGGQQGGMVNEPGHFPEVCKKSLQAMAADLQGAIRGDFFSTYSIPQLQRFTPRELEASGRLTRPLLFTHDNDYYRAIAWDEALERIVAKLRAISPAETFFYSSGRSSNEAGFLLQLFARIYGTNNVNNCSYYCHSASGVGLSSVLGSGVATVQLEDLAQSDLVFLIGANPASNHPRLMTILKNLRRRGGEVIVVNPVRETGLVNFRVPSDVRSLLFGSKIASLYIQPHIGGDAALMHGVAKRALELGAQDEKFLADHCEGWPALQSHLCSLTWQEIEQKSGVLRAEIDEIARRYAAAKNAVFAWTMGITHHVHGVQNVQSIANLALMRGMVGKAGAGLMPIRGHSNVQGIGTVGVTAELKEAIFQRLQSHFRVTLSTTAGLDTFAAMESAAGGQLKFGLCLGGNLYGANPDAAHAAAALGNLDLVVYLSTTLNTGHAHGLAKETIVLPVLARDEEPQPTTQESMFSYVRLSDGGPPRHEGPRSEIQVIADLARRLFGDGGPIDWQSMHETSNIRQAIAKIIPGMEAIASIGETKREFHITGRAFHEPHFATVSGRAKLSVHDLPAEEAAIGNSHLRLMTVRSEGQFNTVVYEDYDIYRGIDRRDVILIHPDDLARLGLKDRQPVTVASSAGQMPGILAIAYDDIKPGNALMYYPEANVLVPRTIDPQSKTPAFKNVLVTLSAATARPTDSRQPALAATEVSSRDSMRA